MKLVVLDGYTLNPGDLNWSPLLDLGDPAEIYERTAVQDTVARAADACYTLYMQRDVAVRRELGGIGQQVE